MLTCSDITVRDMWSVVRHYTPIRHFVQTAQPRLLAKSVDNRQVLG